MAVWTRKAVMDDAPLSGPLGFGRISKTEGWFVFALCALVVRLLVAGLGLDTLGNALNQHWQFLDLDVLDREPLASLWQLHAQPPLLNALAWLLGWLPGDRYHNFLIVNALCTGVTALVIYLLTWRYTRRRLWAGTLTAAYVVSPPVLLNSAYPFYPCLTAVGYAVMVYALGTFDERRTRATTLLMGSVLYLALLRSSFSPLHGLATLAVFYLCAQPRPSWRTGLALTVGVLAMTLLAPAKNLLTHQVFAASSWSSLNLAKGFGIDTGLDDYFPPPHLIRALHPELRCDRAYGPQDQDDFKSNGEPNYNSCYVLAYAQLKHPLLRSGYDLGTHARHVRWHLATYLSLPDEYMYLKNRPAIHRYAEWVARMQLPLDTPSGIRIRLLLPLVLLASAVVAWRARSRFMLGLLAIVAIHLASHNLTDGMEGPRFVFDIEFTFFVLAGLSASWLLRRWRGDPLNPPDVAPRP